VILAAKAADALASRSKPLPTEERMLAEELEQAQGRVQALQTALQAQRDGGQGGDASPQQASGEVSQPEHASQPDHDVLVGEMFARTSALEKAAADSVIGVAEEMGATQMLARANHLKDVVEGGIAELRTHVEKVAKDEGMLLMGKVQEAMDVGIDPDLVNSPMKLFDTLPPVGILVAGIAAPMQLRSIKASSDSSIFMNGVLLSIGAGVAFVDWNVPCHDNLVWVWLLVILAISSFLVLCHAWLRAECGAALDAIADDQADTKTVNTGNDVWDMFIALKSGSGSVFKALYTYDKIANSRAYGLTKFGGFAYLLWGGYGLYVTIMNVAVDERECNVRGVLFFMHFYAFFYLLLFTWFMFGMALQIVQIAAGSSAVSTAMLRKAKEIDDTNPMQLPVCLTLVRAFIIRRPSDLLQVTREQLQSEIASLEEREKQTNKELAEKRAEAERINTEFSEACQSEEQLIAKYNEGLDETFRRAEPLAAIAAATPAWLP
jgi:hypothetical protein